MPLEQLGGYHQDLSPQVDVYGLGALLFEILTLTKLHPGADNLERVRSTLAGVDNRPSSRAPNRAIPPELDEICIRATAREPGDRFRKAADLGRALERYLEGGRDEDLRREAAVRQIEDAEQKLKEGAPTTEHERRAEAMRHFIRAVALDPDNGRALGGMARVLLETPQHLPAEAKARFARVGNSARKSLGKVTSLGAALLLLMMLPLAWMGVRDQRVFVAYLAINAVLMVISVHTALRPEPILIRRAMFVIAGMVMIFLASRTVGPLMLVPATATGVSIAAAVTADRWLQPWMIATGGVAIVLPLALELAGVLPQSYDFVNGVMIVLPQMVELERVPTLSYLTAASLMQIVVIALLALRWHQRFTEAAERLQLQAWYLERVVQSARTG
jgi:serine/threonine-protein kinase